MDYRLSYLSRSYPSRKLLPRRMVVQGVKPEKDLTAAETAKRKEEKNLNLENHQKREQWLRVTVITNF